MTLSTLISGLLLTSSFVHMVSANDGDKVSSKCYPGQWCLSSPYDKPIFCTKTIDFQCPESYLPVNVTDLPDFSPNCNKFGSHAPSVEKAKLLSTDDNPIIFFGGGRVDMTCPSTNIERAQFQNNLCYCEVTWQYDLWYWFTYLGFVAVLIWSLYCFYAMREGEANKKIPLNPQFLSIFMNITALVIRVIWMGNAYNGRGQSYAFDDITNSFLVKISQVLMLSEFLLITLVWKAIVDSTQKMKSMNKEAQAAADKAKYRNVGIAVFFMMVTICPFDVASAITGSMLMNLASNFIMLVTAVTLVFGGLMYARTLAKLLTGNDASKMDKKKKDAVSSILNAVYISTFLAIICIVAVLIFSFVAPKGSEYLVWGWWFLIHGCETFLMLTLATSTSQKARAALKAGKKSDTFFTSMSSRRTSAGSENESTKESDKEVSLAEKGEKKRKESAVKENPAAKK